MNELINYIILGMIQGLTEFFPVSSSGHLVLFQDFLKIKMKVLLLKLLLILGPYSAYFYFIRLLSFLQKMKMIFLTQTLLNF